MVMSTSLLELLGSCLTCLATHELDETTGDEPCHSWHVLERAPAQASMRMGLFRVHELAWLAQGVV